MRRSLAIGRVKRFTIDVKRFPSSRRVGQPLTEVRGSPVVDCHQHLWPEAFIDELRRRRWPPRMRGWELQLDGEPAYAVDPADHDPARRRKLDEVDGVELALLSLSSPLGVETMDPHEAAPLLESWHSLADELDETDEHAGHGIWAAANLVEPDLAALSVTLKHERVYGLQVPASGMADPGALTRLAPVLAVVEQANLPVLVHPGPAAAPSAVVPGWWPALASYPAQLAAAWFAWHVVGRSLLPRLRLAFVGLAGLAPLHHERLAQRGGELGPIDPLLFYETSSYGTRAVDAVVRVVGVDPLVHGSDRPYALPADPALGAAFDQARLVVNPAHLLNGGPR